MNTELTLENFHWVRRLARTLIHDTHLADDVAQDVWLAAANSPAIQEGAMKGWVRTVVRRRSQELHREGAARREREGRVSRREAVPGDDALRERMETQKLVADAVMGLEEPYRRTILLRYFEERTPTQIAKSESVPLNTVKSRLRRGCAMLRTALDGKFGGDGQSWLLAVAPLAGAGANPSSRSWAMWGAAGSVAVLGTLAFAFWPRGASEPMESASVASRPALAEPEPASLLAAVEPEAQPRSGIEPAQEPEEDPWLRETLMVSAVAAATGDPVPGVEVMLYDEMDIHRGLGERTRTGPDPLWLYRSHGVTRQANGDGRLEVRWSGTGMRGAVLSPDWFGEFKVGRAGWGDVDLELRPNRPLTVRVVDGEGEPVAGVPVAVLWERSRGSRPGVTTGANGEAVLLEGGPMLGRRRNPTAGLVVQLGAPGTQSVRQAIPSGSVEDFPTEVIELECPPLGTIRLQHPNGAEASGLRVSLRSERPDGQGIVPGDVWLDGQGQASVRCALEVAYTAVWGPEEARTQMELTPLSSEGETQDVTLIQSVAVGVPEPIEGMFDHVVVLTGSFVDAAGEAVPSGVPVGTYHELSGQSGFSGANSTVPLEMDEGGAFRLTLMGDPWTEGSDEVRRVDLVRVTAQGREFASIEVPRLESGVVQEVGTVAFEPFAEILTGQVQDSNGQPVPRARVVVQAKAGGPGMRGMSAWVELEPLATRSQDDGSFVITGPPMGTLVQRDANGDPGPLRLRAELRGAAGPFVAFEPGAPCTLVLPAAAAVELTLEGVRPEAADGLTATLVRDSGGQSRLQSRLQARPGPSGVRWVRVPPGGYSVVLDHSSLREPLAVIEGIEVLDGTSGDPRLEGFDLSPLVHWHVVTVVDQGGEPVADARIWVIDGDGLRAIDVTTNEEGEVAIAQRIGSVCRISPFEFDPGTDGITLTEDLVIPLEE